MAPAMELLELKQRARIHGRGLKSDKNHVSRDRTGQRSLRGSESACRSAACTADIDKKMSNEI